MTGTTEMIISAGTAAGLLPAAPVPAADMNRLVTTIIAAGNATDLFPVITPTAEVTPNLNSATGAPSSVGLPPDVSPTATPSPVPQTGPGVAGRSVGPVADTSATLPGLQVLTVGFGAVALAIMLGMTRLFARRRRGPLWLRRRRPVRGVR